MLVRTCFFCKHFDLDLGSPGYSEWTPGDNAEFSCMQGHFRYEPGGCSSIEDYRRELKRAEKCSDFEAVQV